MANRPELAAELEAALAARTTDEWVETLIEAGVPCGPIHDYRQVFEDEHTQAREMEVQLAGVRMLGIPVKLSGTPGTIRRTAPQVGEHTAEVLREAGFSDAEISAL
jgi:formyl-CoA transferase